MFTRDAAQVIVEAATKFPIVVITGPRQSGKTTLAKMLFPQKPYVNFENLTTRALAQNDPENFLNFYQSGAVFDEVQLVPSLFSFLQLRVDEKDLPGEFILSGSQNFMLMEKITQSLAGRAAIIELLPLSYHELNHPEVQIYDLLVQGMYPRLHKMQTSPTSFFKAYLQSYVEKDLRQIKNLENLDTFQRFLQACAARVGQLINISSLAADCGISQHIANGWLSLLKSSYIIFTLKPYFQNFNKRIVKQSKLYFYDTGLACALLNIEQGDIFSHFYKGPLFENFIVLELLKKRWNSGQRDNLYFWRDNHGNEMDIVYAKGNSIMSFEVKAGQTLHQDTLKNMKNFQGVAGPHQSYIIYAGDHDLPGVLSWRSLSNLHL